MVKRTRISKEDLLSILRSDSSLREEEHPNFLDGIVRLPNGSVLVKTWDGGVFFENLEEALKIMGFPSKDEDPLRMDILIPDAKGFIQNAKILSQRFATLYLQNTSLKIDGENWDSDKMRIIDQIVSNNKEKFLVPDSFQLLCAFVGDSFRQLIEGQWVLKLVVAEYKEKVFLPFVSVNLECNINIAPPIRNSLIGCDTGPISVEYYGWELRARRHRAR